MKDKRRIRLEVHLKVILLLERIDCGSSSTLGKKISPALRKDCTEHFNVREVLRISW